MGQNTWAASDAENARVDEIPDPSAFFIAAKKIPIFLFSRATLLPVSAAALVPLVAAGATYVPIKTLLGIFKRVLVL